MYMGILHCYILRTFVDCLEGIDFIDPNLIETLAGPTVWFLYLLTLCFLWVAFATCMSITSGAVVMRWLSVRTHNTGVLSSNPTRVTIEMPLVRQATGNHLIKSTFRKKTQSPVSGFCYARNRLCDAVFHVDNRRKFIRMAAGGVMGEMEEVKATRKEAMDGEGVEDEGQGSKPQHMLELDSLKKESSD